MKTYVVQDRFSVGPYGTFTSRMRVVQGASVEAAQEKYLAQVEACGLDTGTLTITESPRGPSNAAIYRDTPRLRDDHGGPQRAQRPGVLPPSPNSYGVRHCYFGGPLMTPHTLKQLADRKALAQRRLGRQTNYRARQQMRFLIAWYDWQLAKRVLGLANGLRTQQCRSYAMSNLNRAARTMQEQWQHLQWGKV